MSERTDTQPGWLSEDEIASARARLPILYVDAIPVRTDARGELTQVGLLLRVMPDASISHAIVTGRVLHGERVRDAVMRHLEKDLGPLALPRLPIAPQPFTVAEYFPDPSISGFHDPRQHAVSLAFVVPVEGDCQPSQDALELAWLTPSEAAGADVGAQMTAGHHRLVCHALAHAGVVH